MDKNSLANCKLDLVNGQLIYFPGRIFSSNVYLIMVGNRAVAVDSGMPWTANKALEHLQRERLKLECILLTHSHFDHTMGLNRLRKYTEANIVAHVRSKRGNIKVRDGDVVSAIDDKMSFLVIYTGIHKIDHVWFYEGSNKILFIGDHLATRTGLETLRRRHNAEPRVILPGHGEPTFL